MGRGETLGRATALLMLVLATPASSAAQTANEARAWDIDRSHSKVGFSIRHFFTPVEGVFEDYEIQLDFDPATPEAAHVSVRIDAASVDTGNERRDADLRSENFFEVERFPALTFESTAVRIVSATEWVVEGELTIREVTRPIELAVTLLGMREVEPTDRRDAHLLAGFEATATFDRRDFGVGAGRWAETVVLGPDVTVSVLLEARLR